MNRIISILFFSIVMVLALFSGCGDSKEYAAPESLEIDKQNMNFAEKTAHGFFSITSNTKWSVSCSDTWLTCEYASGEGDQKMRVSVTANMSTDARTGTVTVTTEGGITRSVRVTQFEHEIVLMAPSRAITGRSITLTGANLNLIDELWFGNVQGAIDPERMDFMMQVTIPHTDELGENELKVVFGGSKEMIAGTIFLITPEEAEPIISIPPRLVRCAGEDVIFPCTLPDEVFELWFGDVKGIIKNRDAIGNTLTVTIPEGTLQNVCEVKVLYEDGMAEKTIGKFSIALDAGGYYLWNNITLYAQDHPEEEKVFCVEYGMLKSICWVRENVIYINKNTPSNPVTNGGADQPRGYHHLMLRAETDRLRLINPFADGLLSVFNCDGMSSFPNFGLPPMRYVRIDGEPYYQNPAYPDTHGGNNLYTPEERQKACYDGIKNGSLTVAQWNNATTEISGNLRDNHARSNNVITISATNMATEAVVYLDNYNTGIDAGGGTVGGTIYWYNRDELRATHLNSMHGVVLWASAYAAGWGINHSQGRELNGAIEFVSWSSGADPTTTGSVTLNIMRKKTWNENQYSYDPNI